MPNLKKFSVEGNNIQNVRADIISCGTSRILKHLQQSIDTANVNVDDSLLSNTSTVVYPNKFVSYNTSNCFFLLCYLRLTIKYQNKILDI